MIQNTEILAKFDSLKVERGDGEMHVPRPTFFNIWWKENLPRNSEDNSFED